MSDLLTNLISNEVVTVLFVLFGIVTSLKVTRYFLSFIHLNGDRVHLKYVELIEPVIFSSIQQSGGLENIKTIAPIASKLRMWIAVWVTNLYMFIAFLVICSWR